MLEAVLRALNVNAGKIMNGGERSKLMDEGFERCFVCGAELGKNDYCSMCLMYKHFKETTVPRGPELGTPTALAKQEGGKHYKDCGIQPIEYIHANQLGYHEGNVIKYVTRHKQKNGAEDIKKAIHYLELLLAQEYGQ